MSERIVVIGGGGYARVLLRRDGVTLDRTLDFPGEPPEPVAAALAVDRPEALMLMGHRSETLTATAFPAARSWSEASAFLWSHPSSW